MGRLPGFDYRRPYYYMVTLKRRPGLPDFSHLAPPGAPPPRDAEGRERWLAPNAVTRAFSAVIRGFSEKRRGIEPVKHFVVMPDHLHLLLRIEDTPDRLPLGTYVLHLERALCAAFWAAQGADGTGTVLQDGNGAEASGFGRAVPVPPIFERDWHDWIVMKRGQLDAFARYILDNPRRAWLRRENRQFSRGWASSRSPGASGSPTATRRCWSCPCWNPSAVPVRGARTAPNGARPSPGRAASAPAARAWAPF